MGEKVQLVQTHRKRYGLNRCCEAVDLSKGTWHRRQQGGSRPEDQALKAQLRPILREHPDYGYRRIVVELAARLGEPVNHKRVKRILRDNHWSLVRQLPRYRPSGVQRILQKRPSELDLVRGRQFGVLQAVSTDFTELPYAAGSRKAWLIVIHDLVSRWVVAWAVGRRRNRELALECWNQARGRLKRWRGDLTGLIVHQDQDSVFTSYRWLRRLLLEDGVRLSYSPNGARSNPWIESLWGRMKVESRSLILEASCLEELRGVIDRRFQYYNQRTPPLGHRLPDAGPVFSPNRRPTSKT